MRAHTVEVADLDDRTLETIGRRLCERDKEHEEEVRERVLSDLRERGVNVPENPTDTTWLVVELTDSTISELESGAYPEAKQMWRLAADEEPDGTWEEPSDDKMRAMLVSRWE